MPWRSPCIKSPGRDLQAADLHRLAKIHHMRISMGNRDAAGKQMKAHGPNSRQIAHRAVGDIAHAFQCQADGGMNLAHECSQARRVVDILQNQNSRLRHGGHVIPQIHAVVVTASRHGRTGTPDSPRRGVAEHRRKFGNRQRSAPDTKPSFRSLTLNRSMALETVQVSKARIFSRSALISIGLVTMREDWRGRHRQFSTVAVPTLRQSTPGRPNTKQLVFPAPNPGSVFSQGAQSVRLESGYRLGRFQSYHRRTRTRTPVAR